MPTIALSTTCAGCRHVRIPEKERTAIVLHYFEDLKVQEIAAIMQIPAGTVKYHLSVGRDHLRQYIRL